MKNQNQCWNELHDIFVDTFASPYGLKCLKEYCYNNHDAQDLIKGFKEEIKNIGYEIGNCYNLHGIGNNNEYPIFLTSQDEDGFIIEKKIAKLYYCYGIYGGCYVSMTNLSNNDKVEFGKAC